MVYIYTLNFLKCCRLDCCCKDLGTFIVKGGSYFGIDNDSYGKDYYRKEKKELGWL